MIHMYRSSPDLKCHSCNRGRSGLAGSVYPEKETQKRDTHKHCYKLRIHDVLPMSRIRTTYVKDKEKQENHFSNFISMIDKPGTLTENFTNYTTPGKSTGIRGDILNSENYKRHKRITN